MEAVQENQQQGGIVPNVPVNTGGIQRHDTDEGPPIDKATHRADNRSGNAWARSTPSQQDAQQQGGIEDGIGETAEEPTHSSEIAQLLTGIIQSLFNVLNLRFTVTITVTIIPRVAVTIMLLHLVQPLFKVFNALLQPLLRPLVALIRVHRGAHGREEEDCRED